MRPSLIIPITNSSALDLEEVLLVPAFVSDFNECSLNNAGCEHVCNNTAGSFNCDCRAGFKLKADKMGCEGRTQSFVSVVSCVNRCHLINKNKRSLGLES